MRLSLISSLVASAVVGVVNAAYVDTSVPLPTEDSWYTSPDNVNSFAPGQVIKTRQVGNELNGIGSQNIPLKVNSSHQYMYRTTDTLGNAVAAVMTVLVPNNADPNKLWAHQTAYDSNNLNCVPSYSLRSGANVSDGLDVIYMAAALNNGWYVTTADFQGLNPQFGAGRLAGRHTLDSIRAALAAGPSLGLSPNANTVLWGYSGGAIAASWAVELQPSYAPELKFVGAAFGGVSPNMKDVMQTLNKGVSAGLGFAGVQGVTRAYPNMSQFMNQHLIPSKKAEYLSIASGCLNDITAAGAYKDIYSYVDLGSTLFDQPVPASVLSLESLLNQQAKPTMPLFIIEAIFDEISPVSDADKLVSQLCSRGAIVQYRRNSFGEHISNALTEGPEAFQWLADRLSGKPLAIAQCMTQNVYVNSFNPAQYPALGQLYVSMLQSIFFGGNLGNRIWLSG